MILVDSSAWIEFLRDTGSEVCLRVDEVLDVEIVVCEPVRMEILAGASDERHLGELRGLLARATLVATQSVDYEEAASLYRICRQGGETPRKLIDCLIAAICIRVNAVMLQLDSDFKVISRHTSLNLDLV